MRDGRRKLDAAGFTFSRPNCFRNRRIVMFHSRNLVIIGQPCVLNRLNAYTRRYMDDNIKKSKTAAIMSESNEKCYCSGRVNFFHRHFHVFETARAGRWVFAGFDMPEDVHRAGPDAGHQQQRLAVAWGMVSDKTSPVLDS